MNKLFLTFILTLTPLVHSVANEAQPIEQKAPEYQNYEKSNDQNDQLAKLLEIPEVKAIYDQCSQLKSQGQTFELSECLWNGRPSDGIEGVSTKDSIRDKISSKLNEVDQGKTKKYESVNVLPLAKKVSESQKKLEEYYYKNMKEKIFGDALGGKNADGTYQIVDHSKFNTIYQNQLTNNVLTAISSFCIEAEMKKGDGGSFPLLSSKLSKRNDTRKENVKMLSQQQVEVNGQNVVGVIEQSNNWQLCFVNAQYVCHGGKKTWTDDDGNKQSTTAKDSLGVQESCTQTDTKKKEACKTLQDDFKYTKTRACELTNYLKVAKQNLKAVEIISKGYNELSKTGGTQVVATGEKLNPNENLIKSVSIGDKVDEITAVTSNEFVNEAKFSEGVNSDIAELESCIMKDPETGGYSLAPDAAESCKKYLNTNAEEVETIKAEYALRLRGLAEKVKEIDATSEDTKGLEGFLKDQGYKDEEIGQTIEANTDIKALKAQIIARYENEKLELIKAMNARMESKSSSKEGVIDTTEGSEDMDKLIIIHQELSSKTEQYAQLIHFNNVVSGFLEVKPDGNNDAEGVMNTASIQREIANSAFSEKNIESSESDFAQGYINQEKGLTAALEENNIDLNQKKDKSQSEGATLGVDKINTEILNYDVDSNE